MEVTHNISLQKYGRDILLQLRMHPLSLRKPEIQKLDIVKDKLYLHQINNHNNSQTANVSNRVWNDSFYGPMKFETDAVNEFFSCMAENNNPRSFTVLEVSRTILGAAHSMNVGKRWYKCCMNCLNFTLARSVTKEVFKHSLRTHLLQKASAAHYELFPFKRWQHPVRNCISQRKNSLTLSDGQFDSSIDEFSTLSRAKSPPLPSWWTKRGCTTYAPQSKVCTKAGVKKEKKVLPIIDPANGKNILDGFEKKLLTSEDTTFTTDVDSAVAKNQNLISEIGDHSWVNEENEDHHLVKNQECGDIVHNTKSDEGSSCISQLSESKEFCDTSSTFNSSCEKEVEQCCYNTLTADSFEKSEKDIYKEIDSDKFNLNESVAEKYENLQKLNLTILKTKLYSMKKEQQKMTILQSFLRFKKQQISESMRNLEDKKIEVANWERNLLNKARKLQEKECLFETKNLTLQNKAEKLEEKERALNRKESFLDDKPEQSCKVNDENEKCGTECSINAEEYMNSVHVIGKNYHDSSMNKVDDGSFNSDRSRENSAEKSVM